MSFYFAYGSNMDQTQMKERCPGATLIGPAELKGYCLAFTIFSSKRQCGCADIVASQGDSVYGLLYKLSDSELATMDTFEGSPVHYHRIAVEVTEKNKKMSAYTYEVVNKVEGLIPSAHYFGLIHAAARKFDFPQTYREFLANIKTKG